MKTLTAMAVRVLCRFLARFPTPLPRGRAEFEKFCENIFTIYDLPDNLSYRHTLATMLMHVSPTQPNKPLKFFGDSLKRAQTQEVAFAMLEEYRSQAKREAEEKEKSALVEKLSLTTKTEEVVLQ